MARTRRSWSELRTEVRTLLGQSSAASSHWTDAELLTLFNQALDLYQFDLYGKHEGWGLKVHQADIVADQRDYKLPEDIGDIKKVFYVKGSYKYALEQDRQHSGVYPASDSGFAQDPTSYHIVGNYIFLTPTPLENVTDGLEIEAETFGDRIANDADKLPESFPLPLETLLTVETALSALERWAAADLSTLSSTPWSALKVRRDTLFDVYTKYVAQRTNGIVRTLTQNLGA